MIYAEIHGVAGVWMNDFEGGAASGFPTGAAYRSVVGANDGFPNIDLRRRGSETAPPCGSFVAALPVVHLPLNAAVDVPLPDDRGLGDRNRTGPDDLSGVRLCLDEPGVVGEFSAVAHVALIVAKLPRTKAREYLW